MASEVAGMKAKVQRWGNSLAIRIPKAYAVDLRVDVGSVIDLDIVEAKLVVTPEPVVPSLDALLERVTPENVHAETDVGPAVGREAW
jgi:antitoxin MazE